MQEISDADIALFAELLFQDLPSDQKRAFFADVSEYITAFLSLNEQINLTSIREPHLVLWKHFFDSLLPLALVPDGAILDWGSGGGFPAVPFAFFRKHFATNPAEVVVLDSRKKKLDAISSLVIPYNLRLKFVHSRGEEYRPKGRVSAALFRAVAKPEICLSWLSHEYPKWLFYISPEQFTAWEDAFLQLKPKKFSFSLQTLPDLPYGLGSRAIFQVVSDKK